MFEKYKTILAAFLSKKKSNLLQNVDNKMLTSEFHPNKSIFHNINYSDTM